MAEVLANEKVVRDPQIAAVLCAERPLGTLARDSVATEAARYVRRAVERTAFAIATREPALVDTVSGRFAVLEGVVD